MHENDRVHATGFSAVHTGRAAIVGRVGVPGRPSAEVEM